MGGTVGFAKQRRLLVFVHSEWCILFKNVLSGLKACHRIRDFRRVHQGQLPIILVDSGTDLFLSSDVLRSLCVLKRDIALKTRSIAFRKRAIAFKNTLLLSVSGVVCFHAAKVKSIVS